MERNEVRRIMNEDLDFIMNIDTTKSSEEVKKEWNKHLKNVDKCGIIKREEDEIRRELINERGEEFKDKFDKKLSEIIGAIMNV